MTKKTRCGILYPIFKQLRLSEHRYYPEVTPNISGSGEFKYAHVITPSSPDVQLQSAADHITTMEKAGLVEIKEK